MIIPTIHPNGTSRERLTDALENASMAIDAAYQLLKETAPNGRDYYPQGLNAIYVATEEHLDRLSRLDAVKSEIDTIIQALAPLGV